MIRIPPLRVLNACGEFDSNQRGNKEVRIYAGGVFPPWGPPRARYVNGCYIKGPLYRPSSFQRHLIRSNRFSGLGCAKCDEQTNRRTEKPIKGVWNPECLYELETIIYLERNYSAGVTYG